MEIRDKEQLWRAVLAELEVTLSRANFLTWFQNTKLLIISEEGEAVIGVPNNFTKEWLEKKYHKAILTIFQNLTDGKIKKLTYRVETPGLIVTQPAPLKVDLNKLKEMVKEETNGFGLNPKYTFERFIVGKSNELAFAGAQAVVGSPGKKYNPFFIYGGVGLGKTHLLQAIGHALLAKIPKLKCLYTNAEKFTNEFVKAIRDGTMEKFKKAHREVDILLIDDIQFMAGKESTQEEFFHTFNELYQRDKQIVITSDRPPKAIPALEERLISRFTSGLIVDIAPPDLETRLAILRARCQERGRQLEEGIIQYLATHIQKNVRELEGALAKIFAYQDLSRGSLTLDSVKEILNSLSTASSKALINYKQILQAVAEFYGLKVSDLIGGSRRKELVNARQVAIYLMREDLNLSFPLIGREMGGRDHTTAMYAYEKVKEEIEKDGRLKQEVDYIRQRLYNK
jgi:chromosomal replication initiator protein